MSKTKLEIHNDYEWIVKVIRSSITDFQCESCNNLINNFVMKYDEHSKMGEILREVLCEQRNYLNNLFDE